MDKQIEIAKKTNTPPLDDLRLRRNWSAISTELRRESPKPMLPLVAILGSVSAVVLGLLLLFALDLPLFSNSHGEVEPPLGMEMAGLPLPAPPVASPRAPTLPPPSPKKTRSPEQANLLFADGSRVHPRVGASVQVVQSKTSLVVLHQVAGYISYKVVKSPTRRYQVKVGSATVETKGGEFTVALREGGVVVRVQKESVIAKEAGRVVRLNAGESLTVQQGRAPKITKKPSPRRAPAVSRPLSYDRCMARVDAARRAGDRRQAVRLLQQTLRWYGHTAHSHTAWFLLGELQFSLGRYSTAARSYNHYLTQAPKGALAQDALAQKARALDRSGRRAAAKSVARRFLKLYPTSLHSSTMRSLLGTATPSHR